MRCLDGTKLKINFIKTYSCNPAISNFPFNIGIDGKKTEMGLLTNPTRTNYVFNFMSYD